MNRYVIAIDQSTSSSKVFLLDENGAIIRRFAKAHEQFYPRPGYAEHDAREIWENVKTGLTAVTQGIPLRELAALALSNQRETTVFWDRATGEPLCPAVVWQDVRGEAFCRSLAQRGPDILYKSGLPLSPYYPAAKAASVLKERTEIRRAAREGRLCLGTVDSYLVFRLTRGKAFQTDVSNAGRTQLMNLETLAWDEELCGWFGIDPAWLPRITPSDGDFGTAGGVPITGVMGDSHAALFGQGCLTAGMAKATYGTGSSVMMNVGPAPVRSAQGLSACVAFGFQGRVSYALEGNVISSGDTLCWLRDEAEWVADISQAEELAASVPDGGGVYLVPAFSGLGAPYFDSGARALICGVSRGTRRAHLVRAALESMAYQDGDIIRAMAEAVGGPLKELRVDGGPTCNALLMQFQADVLGCPVQCAQAGELSALGAGYMAGITVKLYESLASIPARRAQGARYTPALPQERRQALLAGWARAVARCRLADFADARLER